MANKPEHLLLDADGVVVFREDYFSKILSKERDLSIERILPFFQTDYKQAAVGKLDLIDVLPKWLNEWGLTESAQAFLNYWFEKEKHIDDRIISLVGQLRAYDIRCHLASDNELRRAEYLLNVVGLKNHFDKTFFSSIIGNTKSQPEFFQFVLKDLGCSPDRVDYWDDDPKNIQIAREVGINGRVYQAFEEFEIYALDILNN